MTHSMTRSSVGRKAIVAITGILLLGFVIAHLLGNLLVFGGPELLNAYAVKLRHLGPWLWVARAGLLATVTVHIWMTIQLARENRRARGVGYRLRRPETSTLASRTMMLSGLVVLAYIVYHLLHFTFRITNPQISHMVDGAGRYDVYSMVVLSFQQPLIATVYVIAMALLCLHLSHGIGSFFQTMGWNDDHSRRLTGVAGRVLALAIFVGYSAIPLAVRLGIVRLPR